MLTGHEIRMNCGGKRGIWGVVPRVWDSVGRSVPQFFGYYAPHAPSQNQAVGNRRGYSVWHVPSGLTIITGMPAIGDCRALMKDLAALPGVDWSFTRQEQLAEQVRPSIKAIIRRWEAAIEKAEPLRLFHLPQRKAEQTLDP